MELLLILDRTFETGEIERKAVEVDSLEKNLVECVESFVPFRSYIAFNDYYNNYNVMTYQRCFPYIIRGGKCEWIVPYEEVTIEEFLITNNLKATDPIKVDINCVGGAGDFDFSNIISWIIGAWPYIKECVGITDSLLTIGDYTRKVYHYFSNKKKQIPIIEDVEEVIMKRKSWALDELKKQLDCNNEELIIEVLKRQGYTLSDGEYILLNTEEPNETEVDHIVSQCWGLYEYDGSVYADVKLAIHDFNIKMTALYCMSNYYGSDCFRIMNKHVDLLLDKFDPLLTKGDYFQFISVNTKILPMDSDLIDSIEPNIRELERCIEDMVVYLQEEMDNNNKEDE